MGIKDTEISQLRLIDIIEGTDVFPLSKGEVVTEKITVQQLANFIVGQIYSGVLNQEGLGAPIPIVFKNTIGDIEWSRVDQGVYYGTSVGLFAGNILPFIGTIGSDPGFSAHIQKIDDNTIQVQTNGPSGGEDDILSSTPIKIEKYG